MKTQEQLSKMTEQALTFELACLVFGDDSVFFKLKNEVFTMHDMRKVDINDWSWLMPLALEHEISVIKDYDAEQYYACSAFDDVDCDFAYRELECFDSVPQRAIAICLILKLQEIQA